MAHDNSSWITARAQCTADRVFDTFLEVVQENVDVAHALEAYDRGSYRFRCEKRYGDHGKQFLVQRYRVPESGQVEVNGYAVTFTKTREGLHVRCPHHPDYPNEEFTATLIWLPDTQLCRFRLDQREYTLPQLSEHALWHLFFNTLR